MSISIRALRTGTVALGVMMLVTTQAVTQPLTPIGTYRDGSFDNSGAEIVAHDPGTQRLFVTNNDKNRIDVLSITDPTNPTLLFSLSMAPYGGGVQSVAVKNGIFVAAVSASPKTDNGVVVFFSTSVAAGGSPLNVLTVGALPDMLCFTPDGKYVLVANEGEPNSYNQASSVDPIGTVSIIDITGGIAGLTAANIVSVDFTAYDPPGSVPAGVRIYGPNATPSQDIEPEYIAVSPDSKTAWVTLQENNAIVKIDIPTGTIQSLFALGYADHNVAGKGLDASDQDNAINIAQWPVRGLYLPDAIAAYDYLGDTYIVTANEGDAREYVGLLGGAASASEEIRISSGSYVLDPAFFGGAANVTSLKNSANIGRLNATRFGGQFESDGDAQYEQAYVLGSRSFSIRTSDGTLVYDSGDDFEQKTKLLLPSPSTQFNATNTDNNSFDNRSDNKGPEPEGLVIAQANGHVYALVTLERTGGIMIYDITNPNLPFFVGYVNNRDFSATANSAAAKDLAPEGIIYISGGNSPTGLPLVVTANEVSGTTTIFSVNQLADFLLPVELASFNAALENGAVNVSWRTASEVANAGFEVQRALLSDKPEYLTIASYVSNPSLQGLGTSTSGKSYQFTDDASLLTPGADYLYRLIDVTVDGTRNEHEARQVHIQNSTSQEEFVRFQLTSVAPNPAANEVTISFTLPEPQPITIEIFNSDGKSIATSISNHTFGAGDQIQTISVRDLAPGVYTATVRTGNTSRQQRFVVVR